MEWVSRTSYGIRARNALPVIALCMVSAALDFALLQIPQLRLGLLNPAVGTAAMAALFALLAALLWRGHPRNAPQKSGARNTT